MDTQTVENVVPASTLTEQEILAAATNDPSLSNSEFTLGNKTYKLVDLCYDDYVSFLAYLQPFLDALVGSTAQKAGLSIPGISIGDSLDATVLIRFCSKSLPEMVRIICKQTVPNITVEEVKAAAKNPFTLATIVMQQVAKNGMIRDFASFFAQMTPLLRRLR
jgi:hypothetical protein